MSANGYQVDGSHYQTGYQHWDFVIDTGIHYLLGCATKYVARWRDKNPLVDLNKAAHYLLKAEENGIKSPMMNPSYVNRFVSQLPNIEAGIISNMVDNEFDSARSGIRRLIEQYEEEQSQLEITHARKQEDV